MTAGVLACISEACPGPPGKPEVGYRCETCGGLTEVRYQLATGSGWPTRWRQRRLSDSPADASGVWRFRELLPGTASAPVSLGEGSTQLLDLPSAAAFAGVAKFLAKHQGSNPTGSFKDLGMTVAVTMALAEGARGVACASTGNTAASLSAYAARAGMPALVLVPRGAVAPAKVAQALEFGALVAEAGDDFDQTFRLLRRAAADHQLHLMNSINPYRLEGQKTVVLELLEQLDWEPPEYLALPGGNLGNTSAVGKALMELSQLGLLTRVPRLVVVQAQGASPFHELWRTGASELVPEPHPTTSASAIRIGNPANWPRALRALTWTEGLTVAVTDSEIAAAKEALARAGVGCEPASAATLAGVRRLRAEGQLEATARVVALLTGHQLKDPDFHLRRSGAVPVAVEAADALDALLEDWLGGRPR